MSSPARTTLHRLLLVAILIVTVLAVRRGFHEAAVRSDLDVVIGEAQALNRALRAYRTRTGGFPNSYAEPSIDLATLDPLRKRGYYEGYVTAMLVDSRLDAYASPDDRGLNQEFWLEMSLERDPKVRVLIVRSDDAPLGRGRWLDGVYVYHHGNLEKRGNR